MQDPNGKISICRNVFFHFSNRLVYPVTKIGEVGETTPDKVKAMVCPVPAKGEENSCEYIDRQE